MQTIPLISSSLAPPTSPFSRLMTIERWLTLAFVIIALCSSTWYVQLCSKWIVLIILHTISTLKSYAYSIPSNFCSLQLLATKFSVSYIFCLLNSLLVCWVPSRHRFAPIASNPMVHLAYFLMQKLSEILSLFSSVASPFIRFRESLYSFKLFPLLPFVLFFDYLSFVLRSLQIFGCAETIEFTGFAQKSPGDKNR